MINILHGVGLRLLALGHHTPFMVRRVSSRRVLFSSNRHSCTLDSTVQYNVLLSLELNPTGALPLVPAQPGQGSSSVYATYFNTPHSSLSGPACRTSASRTLTEVWPTRGRQCVTRATRSLSATCPLRSGLSHSCSPATATSRRHVSRISRLHSTFFSESVLYTLSEWNISSTYSCEGVELAKRTRYCYKAAEFIKKKLLNYILNIESLVL